MGRFLASACLAAALRLSAAAQDAAATAWLPGDAPRDLSAFSRLFAVVSNETDSALEVAMTIASTGGGRRSASIRLAPFGAGEVSASLQLAEALDRGLEFEGMGYKWPVAGAEKTFDPAHVESVLFRASPETRRESFAVLHAEPGGHASPRRIFKADGFFPFVDRFGQFAHSDWSGKTHSVADMRAAREAESAALAAGAGGLPDRDKWGGWLGGPQLEATGAFRVEKVGGKWWLVDPDGRLFWSHGVCCVKADGATTRTTGRERYFPKLLAVGEGPLKDCRSGETWNFLRANIRLKYADALEGALAAYARTARERLRAWGLNTMGDWSSSDIFLGGGVPYTADCSPWQPKIAGEGNFPDPFDEGFVPRLEDAINELATFGITDDPWCIGFFVNNEMSFGSDDLALARRIIRSPARQPAKREMIRLAREKYGEVEALNAVWGTGYASWDDALASTALPDEARAGADMAECHRLVCETYFSRVAGAIRRKAPGRLYLGCRFAQGTGLTAYRAAARYCDIVTCNIYKPLPVQEHGWEGNFPDRPMLVGEFCFKGVGRGYGNWGYEPEGRAAAYRRFLEHALRDPRCVGAHWFQWADQPITGRPDGENYAMGFIDICDTPHPELVEAARDIAAEMYPLRNGNN